MPDRHVRSPTIATALSFLWPGLGQWYGGRPRAAALFAIPVIGVAVLILFSAIGGIGQLAGLLISPSSAMTVLILIGLLGAWRLLSMVDAVNVGPDRDAWRRPTTLATFAALAFVTVIVHAAMGYTVYTVYDATSRIFVADTSPESSPAASMAPGQSAPPTDEYGVGPLATPETRSDRINILLTGVDSAEQRTTALTDTLLVASIDPTTADVVLVSIPRDISDFPMYDGRTFSGKINSFMTWVRNHPKDFEEEPLTALMKEVGFLIGAPIHYFAAIDLAGFREAIDLVGGVTIDNPKTINDPRYDWLDGRHGFRLSAGEHKLNGKTALAYVRSRQGFGDSDFQRARRQQQVLLALRTELTKADRLPELPRIIETAGDSVRTNFPSDRVAEMIDLATRVDPDDVRQYVLGPSKYAVRPPYSQTGGIYKLRLKMDALAKLSIDIFGNASRYASSSPTPASPAP